MVKWIPVIACFLFLTNASAQRTFHSFINFASACCDHTGGGHQTGTTIEIKQVMFEKPPHHQTYAPAAEETGAQEETLQYQQELSRNIWVKPGFTMAEKPAGSTANDNVHIVDTAFYMPQLNRYRRIWIYLPPTYAKSRKKYPVLYMQDGQNLFDKATSFSGEWGVDEAIDTLGPKFGEMIVVGIDNGKEHRMSEYAPVDTEHGKAEGDAYIDFIVQTLQPFINKHYRTRKCRKHNFIAGSSMGGLISYYALLKYPKKFGGAGIFSPSFWIAPALLEVDPQKAKQIKGKLYFFAGMQESERMVPDMLRVFEQVKRYSKAEMTTVIRAEGKHSEATWREEFPLFYEWLWKGK
jgi:predicted alpha/beta superfamily hydrolase